MELKEELNYLIETARKMGYRVYIDHILTPGGACRVYKNKYIILNKKLAIKMKIKLLKEILSRRVDENTFLEPKARKLLGVE